jgi:hypothetical protein
MMNEKDSKVIDKYMQDASKYERDNNGDDDDAAPASTPLKWASEADKMVDLGYEDADATPGDNKALPEREENIYGYGETETWGEQGHGQFSSRDRRAPRRSSLTQTGAEYRTNRRASIGYSGEMTLELPNGQRVQRRTSITYCEEDQNTVHPQLDESSSNANTAQPENKTLWFQQEEYRHIQEKLNHIVNHTNNSKKQPKSSSNSKKEQHHQLLCTRGLESLLQENKDAVSTSRQDAQFSVLDEQNVQKTQGRHAHDGEVIAEMYKFHAIDSTVQAMERAEQDAADIENYTRATRRMMRRMSC